MILYIASLLLSGFMSLGLMAANPPADVEDYSSGKQRIATIMANPETGMSHTQQHIHKAEVLNLADLDIEHIVQYFAPDTLLGHHYMVGALNAPLAPSEKDKTLARRVHAIRMLVENPALKEQVETLLKKAKIHEQEIIRLMSEFFVGKTCPELKSLEVIKQENPWLHPLLSFLILNPTGRIISTVEDVLGIVGLSAYTVYRAKIVCDAVRLKQPYGKAVLFGGYCALIDGFMIYHTCMDYKNASEKRTALHSLNQFISIAEQFEDLCVDFNMHNEFNVSAISDAEGVDIMSRLKHSRYKEKDTWFFNVPVVHSFLYHLYQKEKQLAPLFACIAEMDAYNAIATQIIASQNAHNQFCFVTPIEHQKSVVAARAFWNVLVANPVVNDLAEDKHIILTGPNAGGKTTAIRAVLQNIVLAQTFGVAAAQEFTYTMVDVIHSYLRISDDILQGLSLFASEVKRAQEIVQKIKSLKPEQKFFFALDELFTGTAAHAGEQCAYEFVKRLAEFKDIQFIYATHFDKLKELGDNNVACMNYKVDAPTKNAQGKLVYPFTLSKGANQVNVALDMAKEAQLFE